MRIGRLDFSLFSACADERVVHPNVREAGPDDFPRLASVARDRSVARERWACGDVPIVYESDGTIHALIWWATNGHPDAFYGGWSRPRPGFAFGNQLFVTTESRGQGIGAAVLGASRGLLSRRRVSILEIIVATSNTASRRSAANAGYLESTRVRGVRLGPRSLLVSSRLWSTRSALRHSHRHGSE